MKRLVFSVFSVVLFLRLFDFCALAAEGGAPVSAVTPTSAVTPGSGNRPVLRVQTAPSQLAVPVQTSAQVATPAQIRSQTANPIGAVVAPSGILSAAQTKKPKKKEKEVILIPQAWWVLLRAGQSIVAYSAHDVDAGTNASGAALVGQFGAELRWFAGRAPTEIWNFSAALNFEMAKQIVLDTTFYVPKLFARVFYTRDLDRWRFGPFLQVNAGDSGVFVVTDPETARTAKVFRKGIGVGGVANFRASPILVLSTMVIVRMDIGGTSASLPNPLDNSFAYEAGFGVRVPLSSNMMLEGRMRAVQESFQWQPAKPSTDTSSLSNVFAIIDFGIGFKL